MHDGLSRQHDVPPASPRAFGWMLSGILASVALLPLANQAVPRWWVLGVAMVVVFLSTFVPSVFCAPTRVWMRFGLLLGGVTAPIALAILFYCVFTPMAMLLRVFRRDLLRLSYDPVARTYWISRKPPGPDGASLKNPF